MTKAIEIIKQPRIKMLDEIKNFSIEQLNNIPVGFKNNIIWNMGHMVATQQGVIYTRAGIPRLIDDVFFETFKSGTKPERYYDSADLAQIEELLFSPLDQLIIDLKNNIFSNYPAWTTRYGVEITGIEDALQFLPFHEGLHLGYIMSLRKLVTK
jgi:hypothetical protein